MSNRASRIAVVVACSLLAILTAVAHAEPAGASKRQAAFEKEAGKARKWLASRLNRRLKHRIRIELLDHDLPRKDGRRTPATAAPMSRVSGEWKTDLTEPYQRCVIRVSEFAQGDDDRRFRRGLLAHELTHCFQFEAMDLRRVPWTTTERYWLTEGSAEWASYMYVNGVWFNDDRWDQYASSPTRSLYRKAYAAVGFYAHIARHTRNVWQVVRRMWKAWANERVTLKRHQAAFAVAQRAAGGATFAQTWATSFARRPQLGDAWEMRGPGLGPPKRTHGPTELTVEAAAHSNPLGPAAANVFAFSAPDGAVVRVQGQGYATLQLGAGKADIARTGQYSIDYCVKQCVCPDGTNLDRRLPVATGPAHFAHTGGERHATMTVRLLTVEEACGVTAHPCNWGFDIPAVTAWIKAMVDDPSRPVEGITGEPGLGGFPEALGARGCYWISSFGDQVWIVEALDLARLRQHLTTLARVAVGDEGWIDPFRGGSEYDVYFRIGHKYVVAAIWTTRTDPDEAVEFATAVATAARARVPPCC